MGSVCDLVIFQFIIGIISNRELNKFKVTLNSVFYFNIFAVPEMKYINTDDIEFVQKYNSYISLDNGKRAQQNNYNINICYKFYNL